MGEVQTVLTMIPVDNVYDVNRYNLEAMGEVQTVLTMIPVDNMYDVDHYNSVQVRAPLVGRVIPDWSTLGLHDRLRAG